MIRNALIGVDQSGKLDSLALDVETKTKEAIMKNYLLIMVLSGFALVAPKEAYAILGSLVDEVDVKVHSTNRFFPESNIDNDVNDITVFESRLDVEFDINPNSDISWDLDFINKHVFLDANSASVDLPAMLVGRGMRVGTKFPIPYLNDPDYRLGIATVPSYYTDSWEDSFDDFETGAFRWFSEAWIDYRGAGPLTWKIGAIVRPEHDNVVLPLLDINYAFNDNWSMRITSDDLGLVYSPDDKWEFFTEFRYVLDEYEIASGSLDGRILRQQQNTAGLGVQYNFNEASYAKASGGWSFNRSLRFRDGASETEVDIEDAPYFTLEIAWTF